MDASRLVIVSNRLPIAAELRDGGISLTPSSGGLATGLGPWHARSHGLWIGWPGDTSRWTAAQRAELDARLDARGIAALHLSREAIDRYYSGFANRVLWPLFHYLIDRVPVDASGWDAYRDANEAYADLVVRHHRAGDMIWVHDYQLMLVPALLRERLPDARIGFFLHIPFPSSEVFRVLPWRRQILDGLLGADLVGFHTFAYMRHFLASLLHIEGVEADIDRIHVGDRDVRMGVFPMGVDAASFAAKAADPGVTAQAQAIRRDAGGRQILLGIDRLDYTKGIPRRLQAIERMLEAHPELADRCRFVQVAVPSRGEVDSYQRFKRQVEETVGRINGARGTLGSTPVHYIHQSVSLPQLVALYCAADVMLVTPLRDGMNLVAKEFVASRVDLDGVLVLSEFAGAAAELDGAVIVNPYDVEGLGETICRTLAMPLKERRARMRTLRQRVAGHDVHAWARSFLAALESSRPTPRKPAPPEPNLVTALAHARRRSPVRLLLDYDGTLVPLARAPELAAPDPELLALLRQLAAVPTWRPELISGRPRDTLEQWFNDLPIPLWAEHGFWHRPQPGAAWVSAASVAADWVNRVRPILEQFTASTPGSRIEVKSASVSWHFREAQRDFGARQAHELRMLLGDTLSNQPLEVIEGNKVIEIRLRGIGKAVVSSAAAGSSAEDVAVVAIGDDSTDDELFRALPPDSITIAVGPRPISARFRVDDYRDVRRLLRSFLALATGSSPDESRATITRG